MATSKFLHHILPARAITPSQITCFSCAVAKQRRKPHLPTVHRYDAVISMSSDVCGPTAPVSRQGNLYVLTLTDTASRRLLCDFSPSREHIDMHLDKLISYVSATHPSRLSIITTNNVKEFASRDAIAVYAKYSINHSPSLPYIPQQTTLQSVLTSPCSTQHEPPFTRADYLILTGKFRYVMQRTNTSLSCSP